jgi:hypothetical protein
MKSWRCNLTALSQRHNLYFVACNDAILVYQPEFPDQSTSSGPKLVLAPPVSSPDLRHYIDDDDPHSITHILVDYLGNDEVLLATCDDGDVVGYRVDKIQEAVDDLDNYQDQTGREACGVKEFFHRNVGKSAWGLAIHREARMIAISANTHEVTVLAYALANDEESCESDFADSRHDLDDDFPLPRKRDHVLTLRSSHNIPSVSFNNTPEDPTGRWLFSACISGEVVLWDLHDADARARIFEMGWCVNATRPDRAPGRPLGACGCVDRSGYPHGAWGSMFLDPRSAHEIMPPDRRPGTASSYSMFEDAGHQKERFRFDLHVKLSGDGVASDVSSDDGSAAADDSMMEEGDSDSPDDGDTGADDPMSIEEEASEEEASDGDESDDGHDDEELYTGPPLPPMQSTPPNPIPTAPIQTQLEQLTSFWPLDEMYAGAEMITMFPIDSNTGTAIWGDPPPTRAPVRTPTAYCEVRDRPSFPYNSVCIPPTPMTQH